MHEYTADEIKVGDTVKVFDVNGKRLGQPTDGWDGIVTKVGRKLVTIEYLRQSKQFRLEDGSANDTWGHQHFKTLEQAALNERRRRAIQVLRTYDVELRLGGGKVPLELIEALAAVCEQFGETK